MHRSGRKTPIIILDILKQIDEIENVMALTQKITDFMLSRENRDTFVSAHIRIV